MPLASRADILLDDDEFMIDRSVPRHYAHRLIDLAPQDSQVDIPGDPDKRAYASDNLFWSASDWAGGEGNRMWFSEDYDMYRVGHALNPRIRGQLTGRPKRYRTQVTCTDVRDRQHFTVGVSGRLWMSGGIDLFYSTDPTSSFTQVSDVNDVKLNTVSANYKITALTANDRWCFFSAWRSASSGTRLTRAVDASGNDCTVEAEGTGVPAYAGMTTMFGKLYCWTGQKLYEMDIDGLANGGTGLASDKIRKVHDVGAEIADGSALGGTFFAKCISTENSVVYFYTTEMQSWVFEYKKGVGRQIYKAPYGYTILDMAYNNGVVYLVGHWDSVSNTKGYGEIKAIILESYRPIHVKWVRKTEGTDGTSMSLAAASTSYANQIMMSAIYTGRVFIYDAETDGLTMLDYINRESGSDPDSLTFTHGDNRVASTITYGPWRCVAIYRPSAAGAGTEEYQVAVYDDDERNTVATGLNNTDFTTSKFFLESSQWDYSFPMEKKALVGFHLTFEPLISGQFIDVSYSLDGANYAALTQITSATSGASTGRVFLLASTAGTTKSFYQLKYKVTLTSNSGVAAPILYAITAEAKLVRKREEWELVIRLKDESRGTRPGNREQRGDKMRDWLEATVKTGGVITFKDGFRYRGLPNDPYLANTSYKQHTVTIKEIEDVIEQPGEGACRVLLVATTEAT